MRTFIELCAGAGGLSLGLTLAGEGKSFHPLLLCDNDKTCCETLKINHQNTNIECVDITDENFQQSLSKYKGVDLLVAGIPCQSFLLLENKMD